MKTAEIQKNFLLQFWPIMWPFDCCNVIFFQTYTVAPRTCDMSQPKIYLFWPYIKNLLLRPCFKPKTLTIGSRHIPWLGTIDIGTIQLLDQTHGTTDIGILSQQYTQGFFTILGATIGLVVKDMLIFLIIIIRFLASLKLLSSKFHFNAEILLYYLLRQ